MLLCDIFHFYEDCRKVCYADMSSSVFHDNADIMEELKGLTPEQLKALIAMVKKS